MRIPAANVHSPHPMLSLVVIAAAHDFLYVGPQQYRLLHLSVMFAAPIRGDTHVLILGSVGALLIAQRRVVLDDARLDEVVELCNRQQQL